MRPEEWSHQKISHDASDREDVEQESIEMQREAKALDKAMENRMLARKSSSSTDSSVGLGLAWKGGYSARRRIRSSSSNMTSNSMFSEHFFEEDEEYSKNCSASAVALTRSISRPSLLGSCTT